VRTARGMERTRPGAVVRERDFEDATTICPGGKWGDRRWRIRTGAGGSDERGGRESFPSRASEGAGVHDGGDILLSFRSSEAQAGWLE